MVLSLSFLVELEFGNVSFEDRGKTTVPGGKPVGANERINNKYNTVVYSMVMMMMMTTTMIRIHVESKVNKLYDESESLLRTLI